MANKYVSIQICRDTSQGWANSDPVLKRGEFGVDTTLGKIKCGDGVHKFSQLAWLYQQDFNAMRQEFSQQINALRQELQSQINTINQQINAIIRLVMPGTAGGSFTTVQNKSDLASLRPNTGDVAYVVSEGKFYYYDGRTWQAISQVWPEIKKLIRELGVFGESYHFDNFNARGRPERIIFDDDNLTGQIQWSGDVVTRIIMSDGKIYNMSYRADGRLQRRSVSK